MSAEGHRLVLADARDFPESITTKIVDAATEEFTRQMSLIELKDYIIARSTGSVVYTLTSTTRNNAKHYYLNGLFPERIGRGLNAQVYGWFTRSTQEVPGFSQGRNGLLVTRYIGS